MKPLHRLRQFAVASCFTLFSMGSAVAGLAGNTINVSYYFPDTDTAYDDYGTQVIADSGTDFVDPRDVFTLRITDTQIIATDFTISAFWLNAPFNGLVVTNLSGNFTPVFSVDPATNMAGFGAANVGIASNVLSINWQGLSFNPGTRVVLNLTAVPEPATYAMLLGGLGLVGVLARRRQRRWPASGGSGAV